MATEGAGYAADLVVPFAMHKNTIGGRHRNVGRDLARERPWFTFAPLEQRLQRLRFWLPLNMPPRYTWTSGSNENKTISVSVNAVGCSSNEVTNTPLPSETVSFPNRIFPLKTKSRQANPELSAVGNLNVVPALRRTSKTQTSDLTVNSAFRGPAISLQLSSLNSSTKS